MAARRDALHEQWNEDLQEFTCKYTSIRLDHNGGARNAEWEHVIPGVESSVVLVAALVNRMKGDLTGDQWDAMIGALYALRIQGKPFDEPPFHRTGRPRRARGAPAIRGPGLVGDKSPRAQRERSAGQNV